jgi:hypothetical protein
VASAAAVASAPGSPTSPMVGAPAVTASAARITVRDDLPIAAGAAATMRGPPAVAQVRLGLSGSSPRERLRLMSAMRLVASLSCWRFLTGGTRVNLLSTRMK